MLFNSLGFFAFFLLVFSANYVLRDRLDLRNWMLLVASYFFYASWNSYFLGLILLSTVVDFYAAKFIQSNGALVKRKRILLVSLIANLGVLFVFKYFNFFIDSIYDVFNSIGIPFQYSTLQLILPVGISFYTFQSMSYTIDVYRKQVEAEQNFVRFALFVSFFPQLVAGPIVRSSDFIPQLYQRFSIDLKTLLVGSGLMWIGLVKKVVFADFFARYADSYFNAVTESAGILHLIIGVYSFAFQIYFDFSGYTDTAIGAAMLLGFTIPRNFNFPYAAQSLRDFWRRWHISLSTWMRDYIYIPLGGSRNNRHYINIFITMFLSGLWHGAAWNFVIWGAFHGILMVAEDRARSFAKPFVPILIKQLFIFNVVCVAWILFRVSELGDIADIMASLFVTTDEQVQITFGHIAALFLSLFFLGYQMFSSRFQFKTWYFALPAVIQVSGHGLLFLLVFVLGSFGKPFIYFQF